MKFFLLLLLVFSNRGSCFPGALISINSTTGGPNITVGDPHINQCGTSDPSDDLRQAHAQLSAERHQLQPRQSNALLVVETYFHFVSTYDQAPSFPPILRQQLFLNQAAVLNRSYRTARIAFHVASTTYTIRDDWATDASSTAMKKSLRRGSYSALNIYFQTQLASLSSTSSSKVMLLGYCTLPTTITYANGGGRVTEYPPADYTTDGCNILAGSMLGMPGGVGEYNEGKTAVHEVGHWFGLLHTFQDTTCAANDTGDYVADTPQQSIPTTGCPTGKDSCSNSPGLDPISNYMDYSTDACYTQFSPDQQARMAGLYNKYRKAY